MYEETERDAEQRELRVQARARRDAVREEMRAAVRKGAALLDSQGVRNWRDKITGPLEMNNTMSCVLGQVFRESWKHDAMWTASPFRLGLNRLELDKSDPQTFGYDEEIACEYGFDTHEDYDMLATTWHELLKGEL